MIPAALRDRFGDNHVRIVRGLLLVAMFVLVGKFAGAAKEMAVANVYGVGRTVDVYVFALSLVSWLPLIANSVLHAVLVPLTNRLAGADLEEFSAQLTSALTLCAVALCTVLFALLPGLSAQLASGFDAGAIDELVAVARLLVPAAGLLVLIAMFSALLLARELHSNTLFEAFPALTVLVWVLVDDSGGFAPLVYGTLLGLALQLAALGWVLLRSGVRPNLSRRFDHPLWGEFRAAVGMVVLGTVATSMILPINQVVAARLGEGSVATLSYALRLLALGVGLGATAIGRALLPVLSDHATSVAERARLASQWAVGVFAAGLLTVVAGWWLTPPAVALIFEHGAFTAEDGREVSRVVRYGLLQIPFFFSGMVLVQLFTSLGRYRLIVVSGLIALGVKVATAWPLAGWLGVAGVTASTALMYLATCLFFVWQLARLRAAAPGRDA